MLFRSCTGSPAYPQKIGRGARDNPVERTVPKTGAGDQTGSALESDIPTGGGGPLAPRLEAAAGPCVSVACPGCGGLLSALLPLVGVLIGGSIGLVGIVVKDRLDRRIAVKRRFEEEYVFGPIGVLIDFMETWRITLIQQRAPIAVAPVPQKEFPVGALGRVAAVIGSDVLDRLLLRTGHLMKEGLLMQDSGLVSMLIDSLARGRSSVGILQQALCGLKISSTEEVLASRLGATTDHGSPQDSRIRTGAPDDCGIGRGLKRNNRHCTGYER